MSMFNYSTELRFNFKSDEYDIPESGDQRPAIVLEHSELSQPVEVTVTLMTLEQAQTDTYNLTAFFEDAIFEGTNATSKSTISYIDNSLVNSLQ